MNDGKTRQSFSVGGWRSCHRLRARPTWFFGLVVIEELWEHCDGRFEWQKAQFPVSLSSEKQQ